MVGLHGLGGIGKTTIARAVYNKISARFDRRSFLENVREKLQQKDGATRLQEKLISNIMRTGSVESIDNINEGRSKIRDRASQYKVLIILDDVDEHFKFEEILGNPGNFASGSRFIITSRDMKILSTLNGSECKLYEVPEKSPQLSLQLFCKQAFKADSPPQDFTTLSEKIVATAAGLPLTLKVLGSLLYREEKSVWEDKLSKLEKYPEKEVKDRLKISYDALEYEPKQIFLDIACFFIGREKKIPSYYWDDCKFYPVSSINILLQRSMLKIGDGNKFQMHDQIRDMGRAIVRDENIEKPWMRSRIWDREEGMEILRNKKGSEQIKALRASFPWVFLGGLESEHFLNLSELRYFEADISEFNGNFSNIVPNLRWLCLHTHYNHGPHPRNFRMRNLVILDLRGSLFLMDDWGGWSQIKRANKLKVLDLARCISMAKLPDFPESGSLEMLNLSGVSLVSGSRIELDIGKLWNLKVLNMKGCELKRVIGGTIGMLNFLEELDLTNLKYSNSLKEVVGGISKLQFLKILKAIGVEHIRWWESSSEEEEEEEKEEEEEEEKEEEEEEEEDDEEEAEATEEEEEEATANVEENDEERIRDETGIDYKKEDTSANENEREGEGGLEKLPQSLKVLHTSSRVVNLSELLELEELVVEDCSFGLGIPPIGEGKIDTTSMWWKVSKLKSLTLRNTELVAARISSSSSSSTATTTPSSQLLLLPASLTTLRISNSWTLKWIPTLENLENLTELSINNCPGLQEVQGIASLKCLERLILAGCKSLERLTLPAAAGLKRLNELDIRGCKKLPADEVSSLGTKLPNVNIKWPNEDYDEIRSGCSIQ